MDAAATASVLAEALPYIRAFAGSTVVVKYGGSTMGDAAEAGRFAADIVLMQHLGLRVVIVHGGGPQVSAEMRRRGKEPVFVGGRRVTDAETIAIVREVIAGAVNDGIVASITAHGGLATGISGVDGKMLRCSAHDADTGFVGTIESVDATLLDALLISGRIPVLAPLGVDSSGQIYNNNADSAAAAVAVALQARKLVLLTDVPGMLRNADDPTSLIPEVAIADLVALMADGTVSGGMIPKAECAIQALEGGVERVHLLDGRVPHALLLEFFTDAGIGTMVTA